MRFPNHFKYTILGTSTIYEFHSAFLSISSLEMEANLPKLEAARSRGQVTGSMGANNNNSTRDLCVEYLLQRCAA